MTPGVSIRLSEIASHLQAQLIGDPDCLIHRIASLSEANPGDLGFLSHERYRHQLTDFRGSAVLVSPRHQGWAPEGVHQVLVEDVYLAYAKLTQLWRRHQSPTSGPKIHPSAVVHPSAWVDEDVHIGPLCVIEAGARIGSGSRLMAHVCVGEGVSIGQRAVLHPGVVLGADGFGFALNQGQWEKIEQLGQVILGDDVELGANTCVDRAALGDTVLETGVKIDNLVQIGHNVRIGAHSALAGCVGIAGSARIGARCQIGGGAIVLGHLQIVDDVHISAASVVTRSILKAGQYTGLFPLDDNVAWEKNAASLRQLHRLRDRIKALEAHLKKAIQ